MLDKKPWRPSLLEVHYFHKRICGKLCCTLQYSNIILGFIYIGDIQVLNGFPCDEPCCLTVFSDCWKTNQNKKQPRGVGFASWQPSQNPKTCFLRSTSYYLYCSENPYTLLKTRPCSYSTAHSNLPELQHFTETRVDKWKMFVSAGQNISHPKVLKFFDSLA